MTKYLVADTETTGTDVFEDRVVTAFVGVWDTEKEGWSARMEFLVNPGIPIPEEATAVHGITNEVAAGGMPPEEFLEVLFDFIQNYADLPVVVMNASYDLSLINSELTRYGYQPYDWNKRQILDPLVIDRGNDRYRKGSRKLVNLAEHYGVSYNPDNAHDAAYDCYLAGSVTGKMIEKYGMPTNEQQAIWHAQWAQSFQSWLRSSRSDESLVVDPQWPYRVKASD